MRSKVCEAAFLLNARNDASMIVDHLALRIRRRQDRHPHKRRSPRLRAASNAVVHGRPHARGTFLRTVTEAGGDVMPNERRVAHELLRMTF